MVLLGLVVGLHIGGFNVIRAARQHNLRWLYPSSSAEYPSQVLKGLAPDVPSADATEFFLSLPCLDGGFAIAEGSDCSGPTSESEAVARLRQNPPAEGIATMLRQSRYESVFSLLHQARMAGDVDAVKELARVPALTADWNTAMSLLRFAERWYLSAAIIQSMAAREEDAVRSFAVFNAIASNVVRSGHWLSARWVDSTDLPVLAMSFCGQADLLLLKRCQLGLLRSIAHSLSRENPARSGLYELFYVLESRLRHGLDIRAAYAELPVEQKNSEIAAYLEAWAAIHEDRPDLAFAAAAVRSVDSESAASSAWLYLQAIASEHLAAAEQSTEECRTRVEEARGLFVRVQTVEWPQSAWNSAAQNHVIGLNEREAVACAR